MPARVRAGGASEQGKSSAGLEDAWVVVDVPVIGGDNPRAKGCLAVVADGMGGPGVGDVAAQMAVAAVLQSYSESAETDVLARLREGVAEANRQVLELSSSDPVYKGTGAALLAAVAFPDRLFLVTAGNCRAYLIRGSRMQLLTKDPPTAGDHPRALGFAAESPVDVLTQALTEGDTLLLCTDGLYTAVLDDVLQPIAEIPEDPYLLCQELVNMGKTLEAPDDFTVVLVQLVAGKGEGNGAALAEAKRPGQAEESGQNEDLKVEKAEEKNDAATPSESSAKAEVGQKRGGLSLGVMLARLSGNRRVLIGAGAVIGVMALVGIGALVAGVLMPAATPTPPPTRTSAAAPTVTPELNGQIAPTLTPERAPTPLPRPTATATLPPISVLSTWSISQGGISRTIGAAGYVLFNPGAETVTGRALVAGDSAEPTLTGFAIAPWSRKQLSVAEARSSGALQVTLAADHPLYIDALATMGQETRPVQGGTPAKKWYVPMVDRRPGYDAVLCVTNPGGAPSRITVTFLGEGGFRVAWDGVVPPRGRQTLAASQMAGLSLYYGGQLNRPLSAIVEGDQFLMVEQGVAALAGGPTYAQMAETTLSTIWYFPEGSTGSEADMTLGILNPGSEPATVRLLFLPEGRASFAKTETAPAQSPLQLSLKSPIAGLASAVILESSKPVAVTRLTTFAQDRPAAYSPGATTTSQEWLIPEASTTTAFATGLTLLNPGDAPAEALLTLYRAQGLKEERSVKLGALSRLFLPLSMFAPETVMSARVTSDQPIVVERVLRSAERPGGVVIPALPRQRIP